MSGLEARVYLGYISSKLNYKASMWVGAREWITQVSWWARFLWSSQQATDRVLLTWVVRSLGARPMVLLSSWQPHHNKHSSSFRRHPESESGLQPLLLPIRSQREEHGIIPLFHDLLETRGPSRKHSWFMSSWTGLLERCIWPFTIRPLSHGSSWITEISVYPERCPDIWGVLPLYRCWQCGHCHGHGWLSCDLWSMATHASALL